MLVKHLRKEFYELLFGKRVLIIANSDIDSVCTVKIFTELLKIDGISFSLCPVDGITDMKQAYSDYCETVNVFVLINCGISLDIRDFFDNLNNKLVFVLDCHRPVHVNNFYDETNQIRILSLDGNFDEVPNFDDLFWSGEALDSDDDGNDDDSDILDNGESDDEDGSRGRNPKRRRNEHDKERRQMIWKQKRNELLFKYTQFGYYAPPSSLVALELSWAISRGDIQYVWWTTVALTDAFLLEKLPRSEYVQKSTELSLHIAREASSTETPRDCLKVNFEKDLCFLLYRHWNLYDSIKMTPHSACMLKSWGMKGEGRFHEMLGELGLPQLECHQKYTSMDVRLRKKVKNVFNEPVLREKYNFQDVTVGTFISEIGFRPALSAFDCQLACLSLLENPVLYGSGNVVDNFLDSLAALSKKKFDTLDRGIGLAKTQMTAMYNQVKEFLSMNLILPRGGFLYVQMPEGSPNVCYFRNTSSLLFLAQFTQRAAVASARNRRWSTLPLVLCVPHFGGYWTFVGIKPLSLELPKNLFGKLFETLAKKMATGAVLMDFVDPHFVLVHGEHKDKFVQLLEACMV
ncbi:cell division control protein 45 homolog [Folsomia candida]|uniref:cell division control protein 45 homolog n=1 Tax=Folsomia candida TaxID=158441 RepID=UPI001604B517|nr:cell division control protein 45 homolog [Folsomia candida]